MTPESLRLVYVCRSLVSHGIGGFSSLLLVVSSLVDLGLILREEDMMNRFRVSLQDRQPEGKPSTYGGEKRYEREAGIDEIARVWAVVEI
jgi:hypothetical protein